MSDNNKLPKQAKPQEFELVELLFGEYISSHIARPDIEYSFQARFQSFIDQIPSYLHSVSKTGFFTHFFFGSFASLLDTQLADRLVLKKLHFNFDSADNLRIVTETNDKMHVFIFTENNKNKKQKKNKDIGFTKDEWKTITGKEYTEDDNKKLEINIININKSTGSINVVVEKQDIQNDVSSTKQYHEITKQFVDQDGQYVALENELLKLSNSTPLEVRNALKLILEYTKKIHDHYQGLPYGDKAREAAQHGFVAGIFNNFRYRENAHVYLEQFAGRGYADIVLLVCGADRATKSIPIIIELKAGESSTTSEKALKQVLDYTQGFQPNNMRILSLADNILCVGMNLDHDVSSFMQMQLVHLASQSISTEIIEQLIVKGTYVDGQNYDGWAPLHIATSNLRYRGRITRDIKNNNAQSNTDDSKAEQIIHILVQHQANVNIQNKENDTPLHLAVNKSNKDIIELFLKEVKDGSILFSIQNNNGQTVLNLAFASNNSDIISCFTNFRDNTGSSILHLAILKNNKQVLELLIKNGANVNAVDKNGDTPLHLAINLGNKEIMKYLIQHSANVEISNNFGKYPLQGPFILNMFKAALDDNGNTILHHAVKAHDLNKVLLLLNATVNLDIKNKDGNTALHLAAIGHDARIFKLLLQSKADINIKNIYGKTAIDLGISNGIEVYPLLDKYNVSAYQELNYKHKHRHHHGESNNRAEHHKDNKTILGHHRVHRDIEDVQQIEKDDHNYISNSVGNVEVMSSSSAGSSIKPIGYSMVNWIRDNVSKLKYLFKHAKKEIVSNIDDNVIKKEILDMDVPANVGYGNNEDQQDDLVKKLSIIRSIEAQIAELEDSKIAKTKLLKELYQKLNSIKRDNIYDDIEEYEEELSNRLLTLTKRRVDIQKQDAEISQITIIKEINNEIEGIKQAIQENEQLNADYFHAIATVKEMALHGEITELFYEDCIRYLGQKIKDCEEEDTRLVDTLQELEKQLKTPQEVYYTDNTLESIVEEKSLRKIAALNTQEKQILQEEEELVSKYSSNQNQKQEVYCLKDQINLQESLIANLENKLNELNHNLATLDTSDSNLSWHKEWSYLHETVDAKNDTSDQVSSWFNNNLNSTNLSNGFIGNNNTYPDQVFNYSSFDVQGNLLLLNLLTHQKNVVKYNYDNKSIVTNDLNSEYAQNLAYSSYAPNAEENKDNIRLLGTNIMD